MLPSQLPGFTVRYKGRSGRKHDHNDTFYNTRYQNEFEVFLWEYRDFILLEEMFYARMIEIVVELSYIVLLLLIFFESR